MAFTLINVTGTRTTPEGNPATGYAHFTPTAPLRNDTTIVRHTVTALITDGAISAFLVATTDPDTTPTGVTYEVEERFTNNQVPRRYHLAVPHDAPNGVVDLDTAPIIELITPTPVVFPTPGPAGPEGPEGPEGPQGPSGPVSSINGDAGPAVILTATDVDALPAGGGTLTACVPQLA